MKVRFDDTMIQFKQQYGHIFIRHRIHIILLRLNTVS